MIPVFLKPEPHDFDRDVRIPGHNWLQKNDIQPDSVPPDVGKLPPYWRESFEDLWRSYSGICAYHAIYYDLTGGTLETDHYLPKSKNTARLAYEWNNFRLACRAANTRKKDYSDVLDPIGLRNETFYLRLIDGSIYPNESHESAYCQKAKATIKRLKLDSPNMRNMRCKRFDDYINGKINEEHLREESPFIWYEVSRQGLNRQNSMKKMWNFEIYRGQINEKT